MKRLPISPRPDLEPRAAALGFAFKDADGQPYWDESACYAFTLAEIEADLEAPTTALAALCLELAARAVHDDAMLHRLGIPKAAHRLVAQSWERGDPTLYGRFDLAYDGTGPAKMLEYNADTPTSLYESAVFQWFWLEDLKGRGQLPAQSDQFNTLHEALVARWRAILGGDAIHLASLPNPEDSGTIAYLAECAAQAGSPTERLAMREIGLRRGRFVDLGNRPIERLFKLYPWEWLLQDPFGRASAVFGHSPALEHTSFVEPPWKMMLSTKAILPLLWEMAPGHPNLLPAYFDDDPHSAALGSSFVRKPVHSREGANVTIIRNGAITAATGGSYADGAWVRQALAETQSFAGQMPVIGAWIVGDLACGIGVREDASAITSNTSRFVPHLIQG